MTVAWLMGKVHLAGGDAQFLDLRSPARASARSFGAIDAKRAEFLDRRQPDFVV